MLPVMKNHGEELGFFVFRVIQRLQYRLASAALKTDGARRCTPSLYAALSNHFVLTTMR
ncbi:hypothetical protein GCM10027414_19660 [Humibacter ginsengiterrae]